MNIDYLFKVLQTNHIIYHQNVKNFHFYNQKIFHNFNNFILSNYKRNY